MDSVNNIHKIPLIKILALRVCTFSDCTPKKGPFILGGRMGLLFWGGTSNKKFSKMFMFCWVLETPIFFATSVSIICIPSILFLLSKKRASVCLFLSSSDPGGELVVCLDQQHHNVWNNKLESTNRSFLPTKEFFCLLLISSGLEQSMAVTSESLPTDAATNERIPKKKKMLFCGVFWGFFFFFFTKCTVF